MGLSAIVVPGELQLMGGVNCVGQWVRPYRRATLMCMGSSSSIRGRIIMMCEGVLG